FSAQYPLWSDGTRKRRWIYLPIGTSIDATQVDAWAFPAGTKLWKEFGYGRRIETRLIERLADGSWGVAPYVWNRDGSDAELAPEQGIVVPIADAPGGQYSVPSRDDCRACHEGPAVPVLGFSALQLSSDRDPLAPHADPAQTGQLDLKRLVERGALRNLPAALLTKPPRIDAPTPLARAALGYLHGNCGHCRNAAGALSGVERPLAQQAAPGGRSGEATLRSVLGNSSRFRAPGTDAVQRVAAGGGSSVLTLRMKTDNPMARMPPPGGRGVQTRGRPARRSESASSIPKASL